MDILPLSQYVSRILTVRGVARALGSNFLALLFRPCEIKILLLWNTGLKAAAAARFVHSSGANHDEVVGFHQALGVLRRVATAHAYGQRLGDGLGQREKVGHGRKGAAHVVRVETADDYLLPAVG